MNEAMERSRKRAEDVLALYMRGPEYVGGDNESALIDLIADLLHLAGDRAEDVCRMALSHCEFEREEARQS